MSTIKRLLMLSSRQRRLCKRLESGRGRLFRMAYAWSQNRDVADDIVQQAMLKAFNSIDKVKDVKALDGWLFRILSNCFIDHCRKQCDEVDIDGLALAVHVTPETLHAQDEMLNAVRAAIAELPVNHRQVITLVDIESFSYAEVASILDVPPGTVMSRLNRARQSLKQKLAEPASVPVSVPVSGDSVADDMVPAHPSMSDGTRQQDSRSNISGSINGKTGRVKLEIVR